ncbi:MAG TPA: hypothetical protein DDY18_06170 [Flavobacterium sp.]|jgi:hypothetical protein|nr:hypothetical protein [Flavobacterium sp.]
MQIYAIKFRNKGEKVYTSALFTARTHQSFSKKLKKFLGTDNGMEVDRRTISWSGGSIPLGSTQKPLLIYTDLDSVT